MGPSLPIMPPAPPLLGGTSMVIVLSSSPPSRYSCRKLSCGGTPSLSIGVAVQNDAVQNDGNSPAGLFMLPIVQSALSMALAWAGHADGAGATEMCDARDPRKVQEAARHARVLQMHGRTIVRSSDAGPQMAATILSSTACEICASACRLQSDNGNENWHTGQAGMWANSPCGRPAHVHVLHVACCMLHGGMWHGLRARTSGADNLQQ